MRLLHSKQNQNQTNLEYGVYLYMAAIKQPSGRESYKPKKEKQKITNDQTVIDHILFMCAFLPISKW